MLAAGKDPASYSSHSFRIRAVSTVAKGTRKTHLRKILRSLGECGLPLRENPQGAPGDSIKDSGVRVVRLDEKVQVSIPYSGKFS